MPEGEYTIEVRARIGTGIDFPFTPSKDRLKTLKLSRNQIISDVRLVLPPKGRLTTSLIGFDISDHDKIEFGIQYIDGSVHLYYRVDAYDKVHRYQHE